MKRTVLSILTMILLATGTYNVMAQSSIDPNARMKQYPHSKIAVDLNDFPLEEKHLTSLLIQMCSFVDEIYWEQVFGKKSRDMVNSSNDRNTSEFTKINYGVWERLNNNKTFCKGFGEKSKGANFYPSNLKKEEFDNLSDANKNSPYTILRRNRAGSIDVIPYNKAFNNEYQNIKSITKQSLMICNDNEVRKYLESIPRSLQANDYAECQKIWSSMGNNKFDFVIGPIERSDDALYNIKTSFGAMLMLLNEKANAPIKKYLSCLAPVQSKLTTDKNRATKISERINFGVYDLLYAAGCYNTPDRKMAFNMSNAYKSDYNPTRHILLNNIINDNYNNLLLPVAHEFIAKEQTSKVTGSAYFLNNFGHEAAMELGITNTPKTKNSIADALKDQYQLWEEAKNDACGMMVVTNIIDNKISRDVTIEDAYTTFVCELLRSIIIGNDNPQTSARIMCFNYLIDNQAITIDKSGKCSIKYEKMRTAIEKWASQIIKYQTDGDINLAKKYSQKNCLMRNDLKNAVNKAKAKSLPIGIVFDQGHDYLNIEKAQVEINDAPKKIIDRKPPVLKR